MDRRRRRAGASEVKEDDGVEKEDVVGNPPVLQASGVGVSTRRTASVMVSGSVQCDQYPAERSGVEEILALSFI